MYEEKSLTGKQRRFLRAMAHDKQAVVRMGKAGLTEALIGAVNVALDDHELIKVRVLEECPLDRKEAGKQLSRATHAELVQVLGRQVVLYRPRAEDPTIVLPGSAS